MNKIILSSVRNDFIFPLSRHKRFSSSGFFPLSIKKFAEIFVRLIKGFKAGRSPAMGLCFLKPFVALASIDTDRIYF
jgi:hypothetical protein